MAAHWSKYHCYKQALSQYDVRCLKAMVNPNNNYTHFVYMVTCTYVVKEFVTCAMSDGLYDTGHKWYTWRRSTSGESIGVSCKEMLVCGDIADVPRRAG